MYRGLLSGHGAEVRPDEDANVKSRRQMCHAPLRLIPTLILVAGVFVISSPADAADLSSPITAQLELPTEPSPGDTVIIGSQAVNASLPHLYVDDQSATAAFSLNPLLPVDSNTVWQATSPKTPNLGPEGAAAWILYG